MPIVKSKKSRRKWIIALIAVVVIAIFGYQYWKGKQFAVPKGIAWGNGRVEAKLVDVSAKEALRVKEVLADEGDLVKPGQVVVLLDTVTLDSELAEAKASVAAAQEQLAVAQAAIARRKSEIELAKIEVGRSENLVADRAGSQRELDVRKMTLATTSAALAEEKAKLQGATQEVEVALANVATTQTRIDDATLKSPILGRVLYRLTEPGEVLAPGGKAMTLVNLQDIYMEIFLPAAQASAVKIGADARITVDYEPDRAIAGRVSFVSPEAQFTPKQVETRSERDKLMFRVKIQVPSELVQHVLENVKTGVRGIGYVKVDESAAWPRWLEQGLVSGNRAALSEGEKTNAPTNAMAESTASTP